MKISEVQVGELNDGHSWSIEENQPVQKSMKCKHCIPLKSFWTDYAVPYSIKCTNEGGYNSTLLCVQCLVEELSRLNNLGEIKL